MGKKVSLDVLWRQYAVAMSRRRPDSVLPMDNLRSYLRRPDVAIIGHDGSFIIGQMSGGVYHPTHFAPRGPKSSVELLRNLRSKPVLWAVTPDLAGMLRRLGYKPAGVARCDFRGKKMTKIILVSSYRVLWLETKPKLEGALNVLRGRYLRMRSMLRTGKNECVIDEDALYDM